jgi:hypothetical protein
VAAHALAVAVVPEQEQLPADQSAEQQAVGQTDGPVVGETVDDGATDGVDRGADAEGQTEQQSVLSQGRPPQLPHGPELGHVFTVSR